MNDRFDNDRDRKFGEARDERWGAREDEGRFGRGRGRGAEGAGYRGGRDDDRSDWARGRDERGWQAGSNEPRYSSDEDETYGSEWQRGGRNFDPRGSDRFERARSFAQSERDSGWYRQGNAGMYGGGSGGGGHLGGRGSSGYGGNTGTDYYGGDYAGGSSRQGGYGSSQGGSYGTGYGSRGSVGSWNERGFGEARGFGGGRDQGYRGRDIGGPGARLTGSPGGFAGRGPKGYSRSDDRIREDVCDRLSVDDDVDASEIEVRVQAGEVTLEGSVPTRTMKHQAENLADEVLGVKDVHNNLRVVKGLLSEIKDKITGTDADRHYANTGTKNSPATATSTGTNGRL